MRASTADCSPSGCCARCSTRCSRFGFFHADPHPGTSSSSSDGSLGLIDFGAVGRLDPIQQAAVVDMLVAIARRDVALLRESVERVADVSEHVAPSGWSVRSPG